MILSLLLTAVLALPVPWLHHVQDNPRGTAWRLDGRLVVEGRVASPEGRWTWLTVGRPPLVAEVLARRLTGDPRRPRDMRNAPPANRPTVNEPLAAAVGLQHAGHAVHFDLLVEAIGPRYDRYPERVVITEVNGVEVTDHDAWEQGLARGSGWSVVFVTADGERFVAPGDRLPYHQIHFVELPSEDIDAAIAGRFARLPPVRWFRSLALGRSHGLMVALVTYADAADPDLAAGLHIAGTGGINPDGTVTRIGGLPAKAEAARRAGADVLLFPASQLVELDQAGFDPGGMELVPVQDLSEAISHLQGRNGG